MDRTIMTKAELGELTTAEKEKIWDILIAGEAEVIEKNGKAVVWVTSKTGEDILLGLHKSGKADIKTRFPERFLPDGKQLDKDNIKTADLTKLITAEQAEELKVKAEKDKVIEELRAELDKMTMAQIEEKYGVSKKGTTKTKMIETVIANI